LAVIKGLNNQQARHIHEHDDLKQEASMDVEFDDPDLDRLEIDRGFTGGWPPPIVRGYRKAMRVIRDAPDERDLYALRGLRFKKRKPPHNHQHSIRINDQMRLIVELRGTGSNKKVRVIEITDPH
jgi:toxin HigB-1